MITLVALIVVHMVDGREVTINPKQVTRLAEARQEGDPQKKLTDEVHCVVYMTDGSYVSVAEECDMVRGLMEGVKP